MTEKLPHWDLTNIFPGLDSHEFKQGVKTFLTALGELETHMAENKISSAFAPERAIDRLASVVGELLDRINSLLTLGWTLRAYLHSFVSTDAFNTQAAALNSQFQQEAVRLDKAEVMFSGWLGRIADLLPEIISVNDLAQKHTFYLAEEAQQSRFLMGQTEEDLAAELSLSGATAWQKLQGTLTSQLSVVFDIDGEVGEYGMPGLQNIRRYHPDETVRRRAFEEEIKAWESVREPLAAAMNGVKGAAVTLNRRRGRTDALHQPLDQARIDQETLDAMLGAMREKFPVFRQYLQAKARRLGKDKLAWWDMFAPVVKADRTFSWPEAQDYILTHFRGFSDHLADFAEHAFANHWIDAEPRPGKRGGAFCMGLPGVKESRILCNFDGSLDQLSTIAHELGHAYHNECLKERTYLNSQTPMTLAETASIFCETIIMQAALAEAADPDEELSILETTLVGDTQVIVDIYSRFLFEQEVFTRREKGELSADDFCKIMVRAQAETYGEALDESFRHPYMWAWKPHYYRPALSFYNFPYAFGLLFGLGLYAIYGERGAVFIPTYIELLSRTGMGIAADLAGHFDLDIRSQGFWEGSLNIIAKRIDRYLEL